MFSMQTQQFLNLFFLLVLAYFFEYLYLSWEKILFLGLFTIFIEYLFAYIKDTKLKHFPFSSLITTLGIILMMVSLNIWVYLMAIVMGLGQKHFLTVSGKHFFNPSNFALMMTIVFFYDNAHIVLGQLGNEEYLRIIVIILAIFILSRVQRIVIPLVFSSMYILLQYIFVVSYDFTFMFEDVYLRFYSVSFILFLLFMLTDPHTTPMSVKYQIVFSVFVATLSVGLDRYYGFRVQHLFIALFIFSPFVVMSKLFVEKKVDKKDIVKFIILIFLVLAVIISIESNPPYYFEMD